MPLVVFSDSIDDTNSIDLVLNDLLVGKDGFFHDNIVRRLVVGELERLLVQFLFLVEQDIDTTAAHHP